MRCLSTFPCPCPWQSMHMYNVSCPQNTWLQFISLKSLPYAKYPIHSNGRIIGVGGGLAQTIAVIKPVCTSGLWEVQDISKMAGAALACKLFILRESLGKRFLLQHTRRILVQRETRGVECDCLGQICHFKDNRIKYCVKIPL